MRSGTFWRTASTYRQVILLSLEALTQRLSSVRRKPRGLYRELFKIIYQRSERTDYTKTKIALINSYQNLLTHCAHVLSNAVTHKMLSATIRILIARVDFVICVYKQYLSYRYLFDKKSISLACFGIFIIKSLSK